MSWSQDVLISILFPYLLPSLPVCKHECWLKQDLRSILEQLSMFYCSTPMKKVQGLLETFVRRTLSISTSYNINLNNDLYFLADIEKRCSFELFDEWELSTYSLYACSFLLKNKVNIHQRYDCALKCASAYGHTSTVALLLEHKADVHAEDGFAVRFASYRGHKETVALLLEHKAHVHAGWNSALALASRNGHKDTVALLLEYKAS
jgi:hypothetical protein